MTRERVLLTQLHLFGLRGRVQGSGAAVLGLLTSEPERGRNGVRLVVGKGELEKWVSVFVSVGMDA